MFHFRKTNILKGQSLVEAVIALGSVVLILSAISVAVVTSVSNSQFIKNQTLAQKYAQGGMEYIRYLRNNNPSSFFSFTGTNCMNQDNTFTTGACSAINIAGTFKREAIFDQANSQCGQDAAGNFGTLVTVSVSWSSSKCSSSSFCHASKLVSCFPTIPNSLKAL